MIEKYLEPSKYYRPEVINILTQKEAELILDQVKVPRARVALTLMYLCGLRSYEVVTLMVKNVDYNAKRVVINSKGGKTREMSLPDPVLRHLKPWMQKLQNEKWVFAHNGNHINTSYLEHHFKSAAGKSGVKKKASLSSLRKSYAVRLWEACTDRKLMQESLGVHNSTMVEHYIHLAEKDIDSTRN